MAMLLVFCWLKVKMRVFDFLEQKCCALHSKIFQDSIEPIQNWKGEVGWQGQRKSQVCVHWKKCSANARTWSKSTGAMAFAKCSDSWESHVWVSTQNSSGQWKWRMQPSWFLTIGHTLTDTRYWTLHTLPSPSRSTRMPSICAVHNWPEQAPLLTAWLTKNTKNDNRSQVRRRQQSTSKVIFVPFFNHKGLIHWKFFHWLNPHQTPRAKHPETAKHLTDTAYVSVHYAMWRKFNDRTNGAPFFCLCVGLGSPLVFQRTGPHKHGAQACVIDRNYAVPRPQWTLSPVRPWSVRDQAFLVLHFSSKGKTPHHIKWVIQIFYSTGTNSDGSSSIEGNKTAQQQCITAAPPLRLEHNWKSWCSWRDGTWTHPEDKPPLQQPNPHELKLRRCTEISTKAQVAQCLSRFRSNEKALSARVHRKGGKSPGFTEGGGAQRVISSHIQDQTRLSSGSIGRFQRWLPVCNVILLKFPCFQHTVDFLMSWSKVTIRVDIHC